MTCLLVFTIYLWFNNYSIWSMVHQMEVLDKTFVLHSWHVILLGQTCSLFHHLMWVILALRSFLTWYLMEHRAMDPEGVPDIFRSGNNFCSKIPLRTATLLLNRWLRLGDLKKHRYIYRWFVSSLGSPGIITLLHTHIKSLWIFMKDGHGRWNLWWWTMMGLYN